MKMHRFIGEYNVHDPIILVYDKETIFQILEVLKIQPGENVILADGNGEEAVATLQAIENKTLEFRVHEVAFNNREPMRQVTLYAAILKSDHFEFIAQKCTEVGVFQIIPLITKRTIKLNLRHDRIQKIMKEAAEQSGRGRIPALGMPLNLQEALKTASFHDKNFFVDFDSPYDLREGLKESVNSVGIFIGPEGGWDPIEREQALKAGSTLAHLGNLTLRAETAAIVSTYLLSQ